MYAMRAVGEEPRQPRFCLRRGIGPRDADNVEALLARPRTQHGLQIFRTRRRSRAQKSRSA
jgi:hypothetical protein